MLHCKFIRVNHRLIAIEGCQVGDLSVEEREKREGKKDAVDEKIYFVDTRLLLSVGISQYACGYGPS